MCSPVLCVNLVLSCSPSPFLPWLVLATTTAAHTPTAATTPKSSIRDKATFHLRVTAENTDPLAVVRVSTSLLLEDIF